MLHRDEGSLIVVEVDRATKLTCLLLKLWEDCPLGEIDLTCDN